MIGYPKIALVLYLQHGFVWWIRAVYTGVLWLLLLLLELLLPPACARPWVGIWEREGHLWKPPTESAGGEYRRQCWESIVGSVTGPRGCGSVTSTTMEQVLYLLYMNSAVAWMARATSARAYKKVSYPIPCQKCLNPEESRSRAPCRHWPLRACGGTLTQSASVINIYHHSRCRRSLAVGGKSVASFPSW